MPIQEKHFCLNFGQAIFHLAKLFIFKALQCIIFLRKSSPIYTDWLSPLRSVRWKLCSTQEILDVEWSLVAKVEALLYRRDPCFWVVAKHWRLWKCLQESLVSFSHKSFLKSWNIFVVWGQVYKDHLICFKGWGIRNPFIFAREALFVYIISYNLKFYPS